MRYVLERPGGIITPADFGLSPTPRRSLTAATLDARNSYLAGDPISPVTIQGDFRGFDMRNVSIAFAVVNGDWSDVRTEYMTSWLSDWSGCILPPDISDANHDLVRGVLLRRAGTLPTTDRRRAIGERIAHYITDFRRSWVDSRSQLEDEGFTRTQIQEACGWLWDGYPGLLDRTAETVLNPKRDTTPTVGIPTRSTVTTDDEVIDLMRDSRVRGEDRFAISEALSTPTWAVHVRHLHPYPQGLPIRRDSVYYRTNRDTWRFP